MLDCGEFLSLHSAEATARACSGSARWSVAPPGLDVGGSSECGDVRKIGSGQSNLNRNLNYIYKCTNNLNILHVLGEGVLGRGDFFCCCGLETTARACFVGAEAASAAECSWVAVSTFVFLGVCFILSER